MSRVQPLLMLRFVSVVAAALRQIELSELSGCLLQLANQGLKLRPVEDGGDIVGVHGLDGRSLGGLAGEKGQSSEGGEE